MNLYNFTKFTILIKGEAMKWICKVCGAEFESDDEKPVCPVCGATDVEESE